MAAIQKGVALTCNSLKICFYDYSIDPPVLRDPYIVYFSISKPTDTLCTQEQIYYETIDTLAIRSGIGTYYVPSIPKDLEVGEYKVRWKWQDTVDDVWHECCSQFTLYSLTPCLNVNQFNTTCTCMK